MANMSFSAGSAFAVQVFVPQPQGFVFAGDTAQTIAMGVTFRFEGDTLNLLDPYPLLIKVLPISDTFTHIF
jgi:hypothetical protein